MRANFAIFFPGMSFCGHRNTIRADGYLVCAFFEFCAGVLDCESCCGLAMSVCICIVFRNTGIGIVWLLKCFLVVFDNIMYILGICLCLCTF